MREELDSDCHCGMVLSRNPEKSLARYTLYPDTEQDKSPTSNLLWGIFVFYPDNARFIVAPISAGLSHT